MNKILSVMSIGIAFLFVLVLFTSVVNAKSTIEERVAKYQDMRESFADVDVKEVTTILQNLRDNKADDPPWYPGLFILGIIALIKTILRGEWEPGIIYGTFLWIIATIVLTLWSLIQGGGPG